MTSFSWQSHLDLNGGECGVYERVQPYVRYERQVDHSGEIPRDFGRGICDSKGMDGCLFVYAGDDWNAFEQKLTSLPLINKEARQFARFFLAGALRWKWTSRKNPVAGTLARIRWTGKGRGTGRRRQPCGDLEQG